MSCYLGDNTICYSKHLGNTVSYGYLLPEVAQFRIWANKILKNYLAKEFALNETRLQEQKQQLEQLKQTVISGQQI